VASTGERARAAYRLPGVDAFSNDVYAERVPHEELARLRREMPVAWVDEPPPHHGYWAVVRHADLVAVHKDFRTYSSELGGTEIEELAPDALEARKTMLETDPPRHTRLRQLVNPAFSRPVAERHAAHAAQLLRAVLDEAIATSAGRPFDFVDAVARELPIRMLCRILGVPDGDAPQLFHWADAIIYNTDPDYAEVVFDRDDTDPYRLLPFRSPVSLKVFEYVERMAAARRAHPAGDVLSAMVEAEIDGRPLTDREIDTFFLLLLIAGNETTRHSLSHGLLAFVEHPGELQRVRDEPSLLPSATEELLRWACPQVHFRRTAAVDTELRGVPIAAGDKVVTWYISANYDDEEFPDPYRFDVARSPNRHVTFGGGGPHLCLGQWLARVEARVFIEELARRHDIRFEVAGPVERVRSNFINGIKRLPVVAR
jgi:cytochrome P450